MFCIARYLRHTCRGDLVVSVYKVNGGIACVFLEYLGLSAIGKKAQLKVSVAIISWTYTVLSDWSLAGSVCVFLSETLKTSCCCFGACVKPIPCNQFCSLS